MLIIFHPLSEKRVLFIYINHQLVSCGPSGVCTQNRYNWDSLWRLYTVYTVSIVYILYSDTSNNNVEVAGSVNIVDIMYIELCVCSVYSV